MSLMSASCDDVPIESSTYKYTYIYNIFLHLICFHDIGYIGSLLSICINLHVYNVYIYQYHLSLITLKFHSKNGPDEALGARSDKPWMTTTLNTAGSVK